MQVSRLHHRPPASIRTAAPRLVDKGFVSKSGLGLGVLAARLAMHMTACAH